MTAATVDPAAWWQEQFPLSADHSHLSGCSLPPRWRGLDEAMDAMLRTMADESAPWHRFEAEVELSRQRFAELVNASPDQIAVLPTATVAAYQVVTAQNWARPQILGTDEDFPSICQLFQAQRARGVHLDFVPDPLSLDSWAGSLSNRSGLVSVPLATYRHGALLPVAELCRLAATVGARTFVDAYQGAGVLPIDVRELGCDYLVAGASKYLLGLPGVAFLYCRDPAADRSPELTGWMGRVPPDNYDPRSAEVASTARRYEIGTPAIPAVLAASAGLRLLNEVGVPKVYAHVSRLRERLADGADALGLPLVGYQRGRPHGAHLAFALPDPDGAAERMAARGVNVSPRGDVVRVAMHLYNTDADIDRVLECLAEHLGGTGKTAAAPSDLATAELVRAWSGEGDPATFPYRQVRAAYLRVGKHHAPSELLSALTHARARWAEGPGADGADGADEQMLTAFLDVALDKTDQRYDYPSYIGLALLPLPGSPDDLGEMRAHRDRWLCWLMSDLLAFELAVQAGESRPLPVLRPTDRVVPKRVHLGLRTIRPALRRLGLRMESGRSEAEQARDFLATLHTADTQLRVELSMLPVYTMHDEYLFIRVLQMFEVTFRQLIVELRTTITAIAAGDIDLAESCLTSAAGMLAEAAPLFSLLATLQVAAFQTFRTFTEGASAIQSRGYKIMESLCRTPDPDRLDSAAYRSVPEVRELVLAGQLTIDEAYQAQCLTGGLSDDQLTRLRQASAGFEAEVLRWRRTHYSLAVRMLGQERSGTGYTEGTPYLAAVRGIPIFREVTAEERPETDPSGGSHA